MTNFSRCIFLALAATATATAGSIIAVPVDYTYTLHLPSINNISEVDSSFTDYVFENVGSVPSQANSLCPADCGPVVPGSTVEAGFSYNGFSFTSDGSDPEVDVFFTDPGMGASIKFSFIEPDSFWSTLGAQTFDVDSANPANTGVGAAYKVNIADPGCNACTISTSNASPAPEPGTWMLLATGLIGILPVRRFRRK